MKTCPSAFKALLLGLFTFLFFIPQIHAQSWDAKQQEVWKNVTAYNDLFSKGQTDAFFSYFDPSYVGWSYNSEKPHGVEDMKKVVKGFFDAGNKVNDAKYNAIAIRVYGDHAFVDYTIDASYTDKDGKTTPDNERWTDILQKKNGKWVLIGDQGGTLSKLKIDDSPANDTKQMSWNAAQNDILNAEKQFDEAYGKGDISKMKDFYAPDYVDFNYSSDKPHDKEETINMFTKFVNSGRKASISQMVPYAVTADKDFAFVDYVISGSMTDSTGVAKTDTERWTDIFQKRNGKWQLVGDHGGAMPMKQP